MDDSLNPSLGAVRRRGLLVAACAPIIPQLLGAAFNIWYNATMIEPMLAPIGLKPRFMATVLVYNVVVFPVGIAIWIYAILSLRPYFQKLSRGETVPADALTRAQRRVVNLPWLSTVVCAVAWLMCIPVFLFSLAATGKPLNPQLFWHLPISFMVAGFIAITQTFFLSELASHWGLFPVFFRGIRPDRVPGIHPLSLRGRGWMWAVSAGVCPIGSLVLLTFAPSDLGTDPRWFAVFVGLIGISFGLCSAALISRLVANPVDELRAATQAVAEGRLDISLPLQRADEFGVLFAEFNHMVSELRDKERLRKIFGVHVGQEAAKQILERGLGVGGTEQVITIMFVDIRGFTSRSANIEPARAVALLNEFLGAMVGVVETEHGGMVNKFLGDGFMAVFGIGADTARHADDALLAGRGMQRKLAELNRDLAERGEAPMQIGIGINTGPAIVGSIGSPERLEFTVIGSAVNLASRIEALTKTVGAPCSSRKRPQMLCSSATDYGIVDRRRSAEWMSPCKSLPVRVEPADYESGESLARTVRHHANAIHPRPIIATSTGRKNTTCPISCGGLIRKRTSPNATRFRSSRQTAE